MSAPIVGVDLVKLSERAFECPVPHDGVLMRQAAHEIEQLRTRLSDSDAKVADAYDRGYRDGRIDGDAIAQNGDVV